MRIRAAVDDDLTAIQAIYAHHVATGLGTFETEPPDVPEMRMRHARIVQTGLPYLVAETDGRIAGYAYANEFRPRAAYRSTVEDSVYVAQDAIGLGIGQALLNGVIERCSALVLRQMLGDSKRQALLHRRYRAIYIRKCSPRYTRRTSALFTISDGVPWASTLPSLMM